MEDIRRIEFTEKMTIWGRWKDIYSAVNLIGYMKDNEIDGKRIVVTSNSE